MYILKFKNSFNGYFIRMSMYDPKIDVSQKKIVTKSMNSITHKHLFSKEVSM